ncbi:MAG: hypothetical protein RIS70_3971, partial [Planctomycetota bacterium]
MREMLEEKLSRFEELERQLADPAVLADSTKIAAVAREHGALTRLATRYRRFRQLIDEIEETTRLAEGDDAEFRELAKETLPALKQEREKLWEELLDMTMGGADAERTRCVMEIRAGTGGEEAALFAGDLMRMYKKHAETRGWKAEVLEATPTEMGGL